MNDLDPMLRVRRAYDKSKRAGEANNLIRIVQGMEDSELERLRAAINGEASADAPRRAYNEEAMDPMGAS